MLLKQEILNKPGKLTPEEFVEIKTHTILWYEILKDNRIEGGMVVIARGHHEKCDGRGYHYL